MSQHGWNDFISSMCFDGRVFDVFYAGFSFFNYYCAMEWSNGDVLTLISMDEDRPVLWNLLVTQILGKFRNPAFVWYSKVSPYSSPKIKSFMKSIALYLFFAWRLGRIQYLLGVRLKLYLSKTQKITMQPKQPGHPPRHTFLQKLERQCGLSK